MPLTPDTSTAPAAPSAAAAAPPGRPAARRRPGRTALLAVAVGALALCTACTSGPPEPQQASAVVAGQAAPAAVAPRCSVETLQGRYLYEIHGNRRFDVGRYPYLEVGQEVYDGKGGVTNIHTDSLSRKDATTTGTYTLDADCHGVVTYASGTVLRMLVSPAGDDFTTFDADGDAPEADLDGGANRISTDAAETCSPSSLSGTYSYRARGFYDGALQIEQGFETFDGSGVVSNSFVEGGDATTQYLSGTYTITPACRAQVSYEDGPTFTQYLSPDGSQFMWLQVGGFTKGDDFGMFGGHEKRVTTSTDPVLSSRAGT